MLMMLLGTIVCGVIIPEDVAFEKVFFPSEFLVEPPLGGAAGALPGG